MTHRLPVKTTPVVHGLHSRFDDNWQKYGRSSDMSYPFRSESEVIGAPGRS
jgi:hypothetical protein